MKNNFSFKSAVIAGVIGTAAMTLFTYMAPVMGIEMNIPSMLASTFGAPIIIGWIMHFMIGIILAINFAALFLQRFGSSNKIKSGSMFSLIPWLMAQVVVMPMMTIMNGGGYFDGFFSGSIMMVLASLLGHLIYGTVLSLIYKPGISAELAPQTTI
ncbi:MAG: DUF6789 family protein [Ignavibacteriaceae bacterium]